MFAAVAESVGRSVDISYVHRGIGVAKCPPPLPRLYTVSRREPVLPAVPYGGIIQSGVAGPCRLRIVFSWGRAGSTGAFSDGLQAEAAAALAKNGGEQLTGEREFALAA